MTQSQCNIKILSTVLGFYGILIIITLIAAVYKNRDNEKTSPVIRDPLRTRENHASNLTYTEYIEQMEYYCQNQTQSYQNILNWYRNMSNNGNITHTTNNTVSQDFNWKELCECWLLGNNSKHLGKSQVWK